MATITLQNYFRLYTKLAGMTGTAKTEEKEFVEIYNLNVVEIPTNVDVARDDRNDQIFKTKEAKYAAAIEDIKERNAIGQPVLVGTISVEVSEHLSQLLIGRESRTTSSTRRSTSRRPGSSRGRARKARSRSRRTWPAAGSTSSSAKACSRSAGCTCSEPSATRRGGSTTSSAAAPAARATRASRASISPAWTTSSACSQATGSTGSWTSSRCPMTSRWRRGILSRQIENAQKKVEEQNFVMRKNVLKYDDVLNKQRTVIYGQRQRVLHGEDLSEQVYDWIDEVIERVVAQYTEERAQRGMGSGSALPRDAGPLRAGRAITVEELREEVALDREAMIQEFQEDAHDRYEEKEKALGPNPETEQPLMRDIERLVLLQVVDTRWREHLENMDYLREGMHLRSMAQKDPLVEYTARGPHHVPGDERLDPGGVRHDALPRRDRGRRRGRGFNRRTFEEPSGDPSGFLYQHESLAGSDVIAAAGAGGDAGGPEAGGGRWRRAAGARSETRSAATTRAGAAAARSTSAATERRRPGAPRPARRPTP